MITKDLITELLELGSDLAETAIETKYGFYGYFDNELKSRLCAMHHFGGYGEYYDLIELFNQRLFN